jgi:phospholipase/carboxylesterase
MDYVHRFIPAPKPPAARTLLLLHGTGGDENDMIPIGRDLDPTAALLSPRGQVLENGMPRFFRRLAEGVFDEEDLVRRAHDLADFVGAAASRYEFDPERVIAVGFSNGANIAAAILLLRPEVLAGAVLFRAMVPIVPPVLPNLAHARVLLSSGTQDPIVPVENAERLAALLRKAGANVTLRFEPSGHSLVFGDIEAAREWIANLEEGPWATRPDL